jgi:membrane protein YdbS with pleckstrin-like domain
MMGLVVCPAGQADGEQVVLIMRPHAKTMVRPAAVLVLIAAVTVAVLVVLPASLGSLGIIRLVIAAVALVAAVVWFGVPVLRWRATSYELTTRRLRMREGIISRTGRDFPLIRISDVSFSQGPVDRLFGCGRLIVESAGENGRLVLTEIPDIQRVQSVLFDLVSRETERAGWADANGY